MHRRQDRVVFPVRVRRFQRQLIEEALYPSRFPTGEAQHGSDSGVLPVRYRHRYSET